MRENTRERILTLVRENDGMSGADLARILGITRQSANYHLKRLVIAGEVARRGRTRSTLFAAADRVESLPAMATATVRFGKGPRDEEDVFLEGSAGLDLREKLNSNVFALFHYALTEIVNNALEHSLSDRGMVSISVGTYEAGFVVRDWGIGVFESIRSTMGAGDLTEAALEVLKGRRTSAPDAHSGEGLFFTRRCSDAFELSANGVRLRFGGPNGEASIGRVRRSMGTRVEFSISRSSRRTLPAVFSQYAPERLDFSFGRTSIDLSLYSDSLLSRSLARRIMSGLTGFREVMLDFRGVRSLGQGFADQVFRIFRRDHPGIELIPVNLDPILRPMLQHVEIEGTATDAAQHESAE
jgi:DNA-binding transcriptional ArsR family regulator